MSKPHSLRNIFFIPLIATLLFAACSPKVLGIQDVQAEIIVIDSNFTTVDSFDDYIASFRIAMNEQMDKTIAYTEDDLVKEQPEGTMGNFMVDLQLSYAQRIDPEVTISVINYGGIRKPFLPKGEITIGNIYEMMPFDNSLVIMDIPGRVLLEFCDLMAQYGGWPIAGVTFQIKDEQAIAVRVNGVPVNPNKMYKMAISDYLANGGDQCSFLAPLNRINTNIFIRDLLIEELKNITVHQQRLNFQKEQRVTHHE